MKKLVLTGKQIALLKKVSGAGYSFYSKVDDFLDENSELPENESVELELDEDEFDDIVDMVSQYLEYDGFSEDDQPTEEEKTELQELVAQLEAVEESDDDESEEEQDFEDDVEEDADTEEGDEEKKE